MNSLRKALKMLTVALSLVMLIGGAALTASAGDSIKPFKGGLDTKTCTYESKEAVWVCPN